MFVFLTDELIGREAAETDKLMNYIITMDLFLSN